MIKNKNIIEYKFYIDVCEAINFYTNKICLANRKAFFYRGSDLRYAVERCMYIHCINSKNLQYFYKQKVNNQKKSAYLKLKKYEIDIFNIIFDKENYKIKYKCQLSILKKINHLFRTLKFLFFKKKYSNAKTKNKIIFNITNIKFVNYIKPILKYLDKDSYLFQTNSNELLASSLKKSFKVIEINHKYKLLKHFFAPIFLSDFLELLNDFDNNISQLEREKPKSIVTLEGNAPQDILALEVAKKLNIPCYCIQQGWAPFIHNGFRNMSFSEYFVWGKEFANLLKRFNPKQEFLVTGSPFIKDSDSNIEIKKLRNISFFLQDISPLINKIAFQNFFDLIIITAKCFPEISIIVKEHPSSILKSNLKIKLLKQKNIIIHPSHSNKLNEILDISDITLSIYSSVILESIAKNKLPIICSFSSLPRYFPFLVENKCAIEVFNKKNAFEIIKKFIKNPNELQVYRSNILKIKSNLFSKSNACKIISSKIS